MLAYAEEPDSLSFWGRPVDDVFRGGSLFGALTRNVWGGYNRLLRGEIDEALGRFDLAVDEGLLDSTTSEVTAGAFAGNLCLKAEVEVLSPRVSTSADVRRRTDSGAAGADGQSRRARANDASPSWRHRAARTARSRRSSTSREDGGDSPLEHVSHARDQVAPGAAAGALRGRRCRRVRSRAPEMKLAPATWM